MAKNEVAVPQGANLAEAHKGPDQMSRLQAFTNALEPIFDERCERPIPRFMVDMPWSDGDDMIAERIIAKMLASDDPYTITDAGETLSGKALVGRKITVHDLRCKASDKKGGWGAYLLCDITIDDADFHEAMTVGAKEAVAKLAYAWFQGDLPISGTMYLVTETSGGGTVLGFMVEPKF